MHFLVELSTLNDQIFFGSRYLILLNWSKNQIELTAIKKPLATWMCTAPPHAVAFPPWAAMPGSPTGSKSCVFPQSKDDINENVMLPSTENEFR